MKLALGRVRHLYLAAVETGTSGSGVASAEPGPDPARVTRSRPPGTWHDPCLAVSPRVLCSHRPHASD